MQLNGFDNVILKFPKTATNPFVEEETQKHFVWSIVLPAASLVFWPAGLIMALIWYSKNKQDDYAKFLCNQALWICITGAIASVTSVIGIGALLGLWNTWLAVVAVYGNVTGKYFDLPLVGQKKLIKY